MKALNTLVVFAKYPAPGKVKTRLATAMGVEMAANLYRQMVESVIESTKPSNDEYKQIIYFDPKSKTEQFRAWFPDIELLPQSSGNLGDRMVSALKGVFEKSAYAIIIGTDCVEVTYLLIRSAFERLSSYDLVLGPAKDGGYYLIGCKKIVPELFENIKWSTNSVLSQTLEIARGLQLSVYLLPELEDIDTIEEYDRFREKIRSNSPNL